jgi:hypothetical protein
MSTITSGTVLGGGLIYDSDTTGNLVIKTGASATTAATFHGNAVTTFDGNIHVGNVRIGQRDFYGNLSQNGWQRFPGGMTMQWGKFTPGASSYYLTFPIAFSTSCFVVTATTQHETTTDTDGITEEVALRTTPNVNGVSFSTVNTANRTIHWTAIGY